MARSVERYAAVRAVQCGRNGGPAASGHPEPWLGRVQHQVFDPLTAPARCRVANGSSISFDLPDHPCWSRSAGAADRERPPPDRRPPRPAVGRRPADRCRRCADGPLGDGRHRAVRRRSLIFLGGTGDTLSATGGTETVLAYLGGNTIITGAGDDTIRFAGPATPSTPAAATTDWKTAAPATRSYCRRPAGASTTFRLGDAEWRHVRPSAAAVPGGVER